MLLKIPVKSYTRKFLAYYLGENYQMRLDDPFGLNLFLLVQKSTSKGQRAGQLGRYTDVFEVEASAHRLSKNGYKGMTNLTVVYFNNFVEGVFKGEFHCLAALYEKLPGFTIQNAIDETMEKFGLTADDVDPMTLRRSYIRYRKVMQELEKLRKKVA